MKIEITSKDLSVTIKSKDDTLNKKDILFLCEKVYDSLEIMHSLTMKVDNTSEVEKSMPVITPIEQAKTTDSFNIRERLPNNVVDINNLTVEQAVTENSLVRCPHCGQAHCITINSGEHIYFMARDYAANEFVIVAEFDSLNNTDFVDMCFKDGDDYLQYYNAVREMPSKEDVDFAVDNDTEIFCPVCHKSSSFLQWKSAFENPLKHFETDNICDACGGERIEKFVGKRKCMSCEKCDLSTPIEIEGE